MNDQQPNVMDGRSLGRQVALFARRLMSFHTGIILIPIVLTNLLVMVYIVHFHADLPFGQANAAVGQVILAAPHHHLYALLVLPIAAYLVANAQRRIETARELSQTSTGWAGWWDAGTQSPRRHFRRRLALVLSGVIISGTIGGWQSYGSPVEPCHLVEPWARRAANAHELVIMQVYGSTPKTRLLIHQWIEDRSDAYRVNDAPERESAWRKLVNEVQEDDIRGRLAGGQMLITLDVDKGKALNWEWFPRQGMYVAPIVRRAVDFLIAIRQENNATLLGEYKPWRLEAQKEPPTGCRADPLLKWLGALQLSAAFLLMWAGMVLTAEYIGFRVHYHASLWHDTECHLRAGVIQLSAAIALVSLFSALRYFNQLEIELVTGRSRADLSSSHIIPMIYVAATLSTLVLAFPHDRGTKLITSGAPLVLATTAFAAGYLDFFELRYFMSISDLGTLGLLAVIYSFLIIALLKNRNALLREPN